MIANVQLEGSWIKVYDQNSKKISQISANNINVVGVASEFFVTTEGSWIKTYDENCHKISS